MYSRDGDEFKSVASTHWDEPAPPFMGIMGKTAHARQDVDVCIDSFEVQASD